MVKRQKEKQYQSAREHKAYSQLRSNNSSSISNLGTVQKQLPFDCCALTLTPYSNPACLLPRKSNKKDNSDSSSSNKNNNLVVLFNNNDVTKFILQYKKDPVTGESRTTRDIVTLHMDTEDSEEGQQQQSSSSSSSNTKWYCPILRKPFSNHTKIIAVLDRETGVDAYVYSYEAYYELNIKAKNYLDLTTGKKFNPKKDVLTLFDPNNIELQKLRDISNFWHIQKNNKVSNSNINTQTRTSGSSTTTTSSTNNSVRHSVTATRIMEQLQKEKRKREEEEEKQREKSNTSSNDDETTKRKKLKIFSDDVTGVSYTTGKVSSSFTSTVMEVSNDDDNTSRLATDEEILQSLFNVCKKQFKHQKGIVKLHTTLGTITIELHTDIAPRTCMNFLGLCEQSKYNNTKFHRLIPNFMIQGGGINKDDDNYNSSSKDKREESFWGSSFQDEFDDRLTHSGCGIVSMANAGPNTNKRQFFITFKSCAHLNRKHSIFGKVIDGIDIIKDMEKTPTDKKDRPIQSIILKSTEIINNPIKQAQEYEDQRIEQINKEQQKQNERKNNNVVISKTTKKQQQDSNKKTTSSSSSETTSKSTSTIGKYLPKSVRQYNTNFNDDEEQDWIKTSTTTTTNKPKSIQQQKSVFSSSHPSNNSNNSSSKKKKSLQKKTQFGDFSSW